MFKLPITSAEVSQESLRPVAKSVIEPSLSSELSESSSQHLSSDTDIP
ncbi:40422_t:CDS:1, partial [Gigaspora margarita]